MDVVNVAGGWLSLYPGGGLSMYSWWKFVEVVNVAGGWLSMYPGGVLWMLSM